MHSAVTTQGRLLFLCDRPVSDPAVGTVAAELGCDLVRARTLDEALAHAGHDGGLPGFALVLAGYSGNADALFDSVRRLRAALPQTPVIAHGIPASPPFTLESLYDAGALAVLHEPVSLPILRAKSRFFLEAHATAAERQRAEAALRDTRARLEATIAAAEVAVWSLDIASGRVSADARMIEMFVASNLDGYIGCVEAVRDMDFRETNPRIATPTLVIVGKHDPATPPAAGETIAKTVKSGKVVALDAAHISNVEQPKAFTDATLDFLLN